MAGNDFELTDEVIANARKSIKRLGKDLIVLEMDEIESYDFPTGKPFGLEVRCKNALFYFIIKFSKDNRNFICFSSGAFDRDKLTDSGELKIPPFFSRWKWYKYFDESTIAIADPMLFLGDEMKVGWYIGVNNHWYLKTVSEIIEKLALNQKVTNENILFFGSSGGGFVSTCLATLMRNSKLLVNNAQFFVMNYYPRLVNLALDAILPTFEGLDKEQMIEKIKYRLDVTELFEKQDYAPHITYYVNVKSESDMENQAKPLVEKHYGQKQFSGLEVIYYSMDSAKPHNPLPKDDSIDIIKSYAKDNLYNGDVKSSGSESVSKNESETADKGKFKKIRKLFK